MKNPFTPRPFFSGAFLIFLMCTLYSCTTKVIHYDVSASQIDSLLQANGEVHILLPTGTNINLVGGDSTSKQKGENLVPGSNDRDREKNVFNGIRQTLGTQIMNANAATTGPWRCPPYCEIVLTKAQ